jgi:hypothetical protein
MKTRRDSEDLGKDLTLSKSRMSEMDAATAYVRSSGWFWMAAGKSRLNSVQNFNSRLRRVWYKHFER